MIIGEYNAYYAVWLAITVSFAYHLNTRYFVVTAL